MNLESDKMGVNPEKWVENYADYLFSIARLKLNEHETAKDLVNDTFLAALQALDGFKGESSELTWLVSILKNKIIDFYRKNKRSYSDIDNYLSETDQAFYEGFFEPNTVSRFHWKEEKYPHKDFGFSENHFEEQEYYTILDACLKKIPPKLKPIFVSKFIDEKDSKIICKEFDLTSSNYWVLIHRAKLIMRNCLEKNWIQ